MVLQNPLKPKDNGQIGIAPPTPGSNRMGPTDRPPKSKGKNDPAKFSASKKDKDKDSELIARMLKRFDYCLQAENTNRKAGLEDLKFKAGEQWTSDVSKSRGDRPTLTVNRIPTLIHQVTNAQRENRPAIRISPIGDRSDPEAAKAFMGLIRYLQRECAADIAYDTGFESAASNGWGYWVIDREFVNEKSFDQNPLVRRVRNPFTIYLDPAHVEPDAADIKYGFEAEMMPRADFEAEFPDAQPVPWEPKGQGDVPWKGWVEKDAIRIARYWEFESEKRVLVGLSNGHIGWRDELDEQALSGIESGKIEVLNERESDCTKVMQYKANAFEILERKEWPGKWIPIVKVIGDEIDIEGKVTLSGIIRNAKEPQRMYNYMFSALVESIAMQPKAKYIMAEGQDEGYEDEWDDANRLAISRLKYIPVTLGGQMAPPPQLQNPAPVPAGIMAALQVNAQDMLATTGIRFDATQNERTNDESGKAIDELRRNTDIGSFHLVDNLSRSLRHTGRIFVDLILKTFDARRIMTILQEDDSEEQIVFDPTASKAMGEEKNPQTGKMRKVLNPRIGEYGVTVTTGPSHSTRRREAAESLLQFARVLPNTAEFIADIIAKYQDWEGGTELATRLAKVVAMKAPQLMTPDMKDVPPQVQALLTSMDAQIKQLTQQLMQAAKALQDKQQDRAIDMDKIEKDFEAKIMKIISDRDAKAEATQEKATSNLITHITAEIHALRELDARKTEGDANRAAAATEKAGAE